MAGESKKHVLIDGSNVLHAWPELRAVLHKDLGAARSRLAGAAAVLRDGEGHRVSLVFDGRGPDLSVEHPGEDAGFSIILAPAGMTADDVIEQMVGKSADPGQCVVATDDRAERRTVEALGASTVSAADLESWIGRARERLSGRLKRGRSANDTRSRDRLW